MLCLWTRVIIPYVFNVVTAHLYNNIELQLNIDYPWNGVGLKHGEILPLWMAIDPVGEY